MVSTAQTHIQSDSLYQEFHSTRSFSLKVDAVSGLNYFYESSTPGTSLQARGTVVQRDGGTATANRRSVFRLTAANTDQTAHSYGWFNSLTWHITDKMNLTGGVRLAYDEKDIEVERLVGTPADFTLVPGTTSVIVNAKDSWRATDWRATLDYHFTEDVMGYATASKAHKAGAFPGFTFINCTTPATPGSSTCPTGAQQSLLYSSIPPESVINLEGGLRMTFFDNRLRINPTGYYMAWTDRQTAVRLAAR